MVIGLVKVAHMRNADTADRHAAELHLLVAVEGHRAADIGISIGPDGHETRRINCKAAGLPAVALIVERDRLVHADCQANRGDLDCERTTDEIVGVGLRRSLFGTMVGRRSFMPVLLQVPVEAHTGSHVYKSVLGHR